MLNDYIRDLVAVLSLMLALYFWVFPSTGRRIGRAVAYILPRGSRRRRIVRALCAASAVIFLVLLIVPVLDRMRLAAARKTPSRVGTISYVSSEGERKLGDSPQLNVYCVRPDGSQLQQVTHTQDEYHPSFAPEGSEYVYTGVTLQGEKNLYTRELWGDESPELLLSEPGVDNEQPAWSPDGRTIAFQSTRNGRTCIRLLDLETGVARQLDGQPSGFDCESPAWSPDGRLIAFSANNETDSELVVQDVSNGEVQTFVDDENRRMSSPAFRPKSKQVSFVVRDDQTGKGLLYTVKLDDPNAEWRALQTIHECVERPAWSRRGNRLAYLAKEDGEYHLFTVNPDGSQLQRFTNYVTSSPEWSPRRDDILYGAHYEGGYELELYDTRQFMVSRLTNNSGSFDVPRLSPDGTTIAAGRWQWRRFDGKWHYQVVLLASGECTPLDTQAADLVEAFNPSWTADGRQLYFDGKAASSGRWDVFATLWPGVMRARSLSRAIDAESVAQPDSLPKGGAVARLTISGSSQVAVLSTTNAAAPATIARTLGEGQNPTCDHMGTTVAFTSVRSRFKDRAGHDLAQIYLASTRSGRPYRLTTPGDGTAYSYPRWSPDGSSIVVQTTRWNPDGSERNEIHVLRLVRPLLSRHRLIARGYSLGPGKSPSWSSASYAATNHVRSVIGLQ